MKKGFTFIVLLTLTAVAMLVMSMGVIPALSANGDGTVVTVVMEDFEDGDVAGWMPTDPPVQGYIEAVATPVSPSGGDYVGKVIFGGSCYGPWTYPFDPATPDSISWYFRADGDTSHPCGLGFWPCQSTVQDGSLARISYHQGFLQYHIAGWDYGQIMAASTGTWYRIELRNIDWDDKKFDIWVDEVEKVVGVSFNNLNVEHVDMFVNIACPSASGPSYLDDILITVTETPAYIATATGSGTACFTTSNGTVEDLTAVATPSDPPTAFPHGMFSFKITGLSHEAEVTLTVELPDPVPVGTKWWKYHNNTWSPMDIGDDDGDNVITVALKDGRTPDDEDLIAGQITDQGGPGNPGSVGWETYPISRMRVMLPWIGLLSAAVAGASLLALRRRRMQG